MFDKLTFEKFAELAKEHKRIAVYEEISGDQITPISAYLAIKNSYKSITLLESNPKGKNSSRYSHLCFEEVASFKSHQKKFTANFQGKTTVRTSDPFALLREYHHQLSTKTIHPLSGFVGGLVGYVSYDAIRLIEEMPDGNSSNIDMPELFFRCYKNNIVFDHQESKVVITTVAEIEKSPEKAFQTARETIKNISNFLKKMPQTPQQEPNPSMNADTRSEISTDIDDEEFKNKVEKAKDYIKEGDVFQVVLSRQFSVDFQSTPFNLYRALRYCSPSPYMFYLEADDFTLAGASPEKLISINSNLIESCPLAGTRSRSKTISDEIIANDLETDKKETAEHMMLVDLTRNDLGAVVKAGSVNVKKLKEVETFSHVMHLSSTIQGILREDKDVFDAIKASFPAGTLSGAPKIRAMEIIDELENSKRGVYGGAICAIDTKGNLESCIAIRMAVVKDNKAHIRTGAGIVFDSDPQSEADETRHKARSVLQSINLTRGEFA